MQTKNPLAKVAVKVITRTPMTPMRAAARRLLCDADAAVPFAPVPYVWTDQYDRKIQIAGRIQDGDEMRIVDGSLAERRGVEQRCAAGAVYGLKW